MFTKSLYFLGSEDQAKKWGPLIDSCRIIGCYAQTEVGHGSNVASLETTATLDKNTDEFVLHTPSLRAAKFWPGSLGICANHAMVFARCIANDIDYGVQTFLVPIRSLDTHLPLTGVNVGDVGSKFGYNTVDNGYLSFDQVRVPRENMLARFVFIDKDGNFELKGDPRTLYQVMVSTRLLIMYGTAQHILEASVTAIRYAAVRRQFANQVGSEMERKLLDYQTHMHTLGPALAMGVTIAFSCHKIRELYNFSCKEVERGSFKMFEVLHHFTSGFKSIFSEMSYAEIDKLRQACGGAGYLLSAGIAFNFQCSSPFPTYEGVNVVMLQQSSRMLLKNVKKVKEGKAAKDYFAYLNNWERVLSSKNQARTVS